MPQLFDLETNPHEAKDLGQSPAHPEVRARFEQALRALLDPDADQEARIAALGGPEAIKQRSDFGYNPAPGQAPVFG